jgi:hypothetical protein
VRPWGMGGGDRWSSLVHGAAPVGQATDVWGGNVHWLLGLWQQQLLLLLLQGHRLMRQGGRHVRWGNEARRVYQRHLRVFRV